MRSLFTRSFIFFLAFFIPKLIFSQTITENELKGDVKRFAKSANLKTPKVGSGYMKKIEFQPYVITEDESFSLNCEVKVIGIQSIIIYMQIIYNNNQVDSLILFDDGLNGDDSANDNIFTKTDLNLSDKSQNVGSYFIRNCDVKYIFDNGSVVKENIDLSLGIRYTNTKIVDTPEVYKINDTIQYSSHVVNFVKGWNWDQSISDYESEYSRIIGIALKNYYKFFPDDRDFISIGTTYLTPGAPAGQFGSMSNNVVGLSDCPNNSCLFDNSNYYGSNGRLKGVIDLFYTSGGQPILINHELLHQWAADLNPNLRLTDGTGHWSVVEFNNSGFGSGWQRSHIYHYNDSIYRAYIDDATYNNHYNTLELYLMGLLPFDSVSFPIKTWINYKSLGYVLFDNSVVPYLWGWEFTADSIHYVTKNEYLKFMPLRNPTYSNSQKDFTMALIVISDRLLTPNEMAYYDYIMKANEKKDPQVYSPSDYMGISFYNATGGRGTLTTKLSGIVNQDIWNTSYPLPTEPINLFISQDSTPQAEKYNALATKTGRDGLIETVFNSDITDKVALQTWNFNKSTPLFVYDSHDWGKGIYKDDKLLYDGYNGDNIDSIRIHGGTTKFVGSLGIPAYDIYLPDVINRMNLVVTGDKIADGSSFNCIEVPGNYFSSATNLQPGQANASGNINIPTNVNSFMIYYSYLYKSVLHNKNLARIPLVLFKIVKGKYEFIGTNPSVKVIMERNSNPPIIYIKENSDRDSLIWDITDENFHKAYYTIDDGAKITIPQSGRIKLGLIKGSHIIKITAYNYFRLVSEKSNYRIITAVEESTFEAKIWIYPNPANEYLIINLGDIIVGKLITEIYSNDGVMQDNQVFQGDEEKRVEIETLKKGIYFLKITIYSPGGEVNTVTKKFVKY